MERGPQSSIDEIREAFWRARMAGSARLLMNLERSMDGADIARRAEEAIVELGNLIANAPDEVLQLAIPGHLREIPKRRGSSHL